MIKDTDGQIFGRGLGGSKHRRWGVPPFCCKCMSVWTPWVLYYCNLMEAFSSRHDPLLTPLPALSPAWRMRGSIGNSRLLIMAWFFWWTAPFQEPARVALKEQKMALVLLLLRNPQAFQEPCDRDGVKYKYQNKRCSIQVVFSLRKLQDSRELCARNQGQGLGCIFSIISQQAPSV